MSSFRAEPLSRKDISFLAYKTRNILDLSDTEPFPIMEFIECVLPQVDLDFILEIETYKVMKGCNGLTYPSEHHMILREDVYVGAVKGEGRDRFTVCHELGHYLLHTTDRVALARTQGVIPAYADPEWQANAFAADLLIPPYSITGLSINDIADRYKVSYQAAGIQTSRKK